MESSCLSEEEEEEESHPIYMASLHFRDLIDYIHYTCEYLSCYNIQCELV